MQCEINVETGEKLTPTKPVWSGNGGRYLESPHLYHIGDWYYMMVAEGGTEYGHMVTYARSKDPYGPFESYPAIRYLPTVIWVVMRTVFRVLAMVIWYRMRKAIHLWSA